MKNILALLLLATPCLAQVQVSSGVQLGSSGVYDILSPSKPSGTIAMGPNIENQTVANSASLTLVNYTGGSPGYVSRIWLGVSSSTTDPSNNTINIYYDGHGSPDITIPVQNMFLATYLYPGVAAPTGDTAIPSVVSSYYTRVNSQGTGGANNYGLEFKLPIPFNTGIKITYTNTSGVSNSIWAMVEYHTGVPTALWGNTRVLHMDSITRQTGIAANAVTTLANYTGGQPGRFVGLWWMYDGLVGSVSPVGAPMEGDFYLYLDGSVTASYQSTGTEDLSGLSNYFSGNGTGGTGGGNSTQIQGGYSDADGQVSVTYMSATANRRDGFVRYYLNDPITFTSGLKWTWACGDTTQVSFTGTCTIWTTVIYYTQS